MHLASLPSHRRFLPGSIGGRLLRSLSRGGKLRSVSLSSLEGPAFHVIRLRFVPRVRPSVVVARVGEWIVVCFRSGSLFADLP